MNQKNLLFTSLVLLLIALVFLFFNIMKTEVSEEDNSIDQVNVALDEELTLFYGDGCQYCTVVNNYIDQKNIENLTQLQVKEIYFNEENSSEFDSKFSQCQPQPPFRGVPLLWHGGFCIMGEQEIVDYLDSLLN